MSSDQAGAVVVGIVGGVVCLLMREWFCAWIMAVVVVVMGVVGGDDKL